MENPARPGINAGGPEDQPVARGDVGATSHRRHLRHAERGAKFLDRRSRLRISDSASASAVTGPGLGWQAPLPRHELRVLGFAHRVA